MANNTQEIKARLRSVKTIKKTTNAMQMIANAKFAKKLSMMEKNKTYSYHLQNMINDLMSSLTSNDSVFMREHYSEDVLTIVFCSDLGLCGSYNSNVFKMANRSLNRNHPTVVIGTSLYEQFKRDFNVINEISPIENITYESLSVIANMIIDKFLNDEISGFQILYTKYVNSVTFETTITKILPFESSEGNGNSEVIFEPAKDKVLNKAIEMMIKNVTYALALETMTAEQASRRSAMKSATDNAIELEDSLFLAFNQARQAAITQEITEIVAGADAL